VRQLTDEEVASLRPQAEKYIAVSRAHRERTGSGRCPGIDERSDRRK
jgi:hypothetical protein